LKPLGLHAISEALQKQGVKLAVAHRFDAAAVDQAETMIQGLYADQGQKVRVDYTLKPIAPRSMEAAFHVVQLIS